jgi:hypothetical protein
MRNECLACGADLVACSVWDGAVGPFCTPLCRDKQADREVWHRAVAYADRVSAKTNFAGADHVNASDVARAFVIGYAAGLEAGHVEVRRTVRK